MIKSFKQDWLEEFWNSGKHKRISPEISKRLGRKLDMLHSAKEIIDLMSPPSNHLHKLHGDRKDQWAIAVNGPWRLCFRFRMVIFMTLNLFSTIRRLDNDAAQRQKTNTSG